jgi:hypothetical protein
MKGRVTRYSGDDIAAAFGRPLPATLCAGCGHPRHNHRREVTPDPEGRLFHSTEEHYECTRRDRRRRAGVCPCEAFAEPEVRS